MVQKVGLAAYNACENGFRRFDGEREDIQEYLREKLAFIGRAAIEAMQEPTVKMVSAALPDGVWIEDASVEAMWGRMIDAALSRST